jgi:AcrR family transcriptional regulator
MGSDSHNSAPRELRAQGRKTMRKLENAGMQVFAERGYHQARVDDIVRVARTSHGTFYLYFSNKEDLLRALAVTCAEQLDELADTVGTIDSTDDGYVELRAFLDRFVSTYRQYGVVIRAWMEGQVSEPDVDRLGVKAFTHIANALSAQIAASGCAQAEDPAASVAALMALLERFSYAVASRNVDLDDGAGLDSLARLVHRGFFGAAAA